MGLFSLRDRTAIVTGAAGLLGRRHCAALALAGANVVATDLDVEGCAAALVDDTRGLACAADVTNAESLRALRARVLERFGRIDVLVNNAALDEKVQGPSAAPVGFEDLPLDEWERALRVNVTGVFLCCQVFGAVMAQAGRGSIVNVASTYGVVAPDQSLYLRPDGTQALYKSAAYPTTKAALLGLTRYLATWWGRQGVRVNALCPGGVEHEQAGWFVERYASRTPLGRMAEPSDYEGALVFLASDASAYMTGANLIVDGGFTAW